VTRGRLPQRAGWPNLNGGWAAAAVPYSLSIVTVALSVTIPPQFGSNVSDAQINWFCWGCHFGRKCRGVPLGVYPRCLGLQRANIPG